MLSYDDIAIVVAVAERGSFIAASKMLGMPSSTVSRRVSEFENQLELRLFERNTRSLKLTQKGAELVAACTHQIQALQEAVHTVTTDTNSLSGALRVSAPLTLGNDLMTPCFTAFINQYPRIKLELDLSNDCAELFEQDIDIALRVGPLKDSELVAQKLFSTDMVLCASPDFIHQHTIQVENIHSIENKPFLNYQNTPAPIHAYHLTTQCDQTINVSEKFSSNNTQVLKTACLKGLGVACLPQVSVQGELDRAELIRIFDDYHFADAKQVYAVYPSKRHFPMASQVFIEHIQQFMMQF